MIKWIVLCKAETWDVLCVLFPLLSNLCFIFWARLHIYSAYVHSLWFSKDVGWVYLIYLLPRLKLLFMETC